MGRHFEMMCEGHKDENSPFYKAPGVTTMPDHSPCHMTMQDGVEDFSEKSTISWPAALEGVLTNPAIAPSLTADVTNQFSKSTKGGLALLTLL